MAVTDGPAVTMQNVRAYRPPRGPPHTVATKRYYDPPLAGDSGEAVAAVQLPHAVVHPHRPTGASPLPAPSSAVAHPPASSSSPAAPLSPVAGSDRYLALLLRSVLVWMCTVVDKVAPGEAGGDWCRPEGGTRSAWVADWGGGSSSRGEVGTGCCCSQ